MLNRRRQMNIHNKIAMKMCIGRRPLYPLIVLLLALFILLSSVNCQKSMVRQYTCVDFLKSIL